VAAFRARYGNGPRIVGTYSPDVLSNGGETITLVDSTGFVIESFAYDDDTPWPTSPDEVGFSLVRRGTSLDPVLAESWRTSTVQGGNPGSSDSTQFAGDPNADDNGNGVSNLLDYALGGGDPNDLLVISVFEGYFYLSHGRNLAADDITYTIERTTALFSWSNASTHIELVGETIPANGTVTRVWRSMNPIIASDPKDFYRLRVTRP